MSIIDELDATREAAEDAAWAYQDQVCLRIPPNLDSHSSANWTPVPRQTGQSERSDARG